MTGFRTAHAVVDDWRTAAERVAAGLSGDADTERPEMGFVYVSDRFAGSYADIVASLRQGTGVRDWTGSVGLGVLADDEELNDRPAIAAAVLSLPAGSWRLVADSAVLPTADGAGPDDDALFPVAVVHADAGHADTSAQIARLAERSGAFLVGGLASSRQALPPAPPPFTGSAVSGVLLREDVALRTGLSQGCTPVGPVHRVNGGRDQVITSLDGRPALDVFYEDIGDDLARDPSRIGGYIHAALPLADSDRADYLVRNLVGIDPQRRWLAVGADIAPGDRIMFVRRDAQSARQDLDRMLADVCRRLDAPPTGALYFSCVARGERLFGQPGTELAMIRHAIGPLPLLGFACGGEICNGRIYAYTGILVVFT